MNRLLDIVILSVNQVVSLTDLLAVRLEQIVKGLLIGFILISSELGVIRTVLYCNLAHHSRHNRVDTVGNLLVLDKVFLIDVIPEVRGISLIIDAALGMANELFDSSLALLVVLSLLLQVLFDSLDILFFLLLLIFDPSTHVM